MKNVTDFLESGAIIPIALVASAVMGAVAIMSFLLVPFITEPVAEMRIETSDQTIRKGDTITVNIVVNSSIPVNVFAGELNFDNTILEVESIDYNLSIADLWAELPWYSNGEGTLNFAGGTTKKGAFWGTGSLITVTFKAQGEGDGTLSIQNPKIFKHDGLGTEAPVSQPIDTLITVQPYVSENNVIAQSSIGRTYRVVTELPSTDLNGDGRQSIADISIFMLHLAGDDTRYDFNGDGKINTGDLSIVLNAK